MSRRLHDLWGGLELPGAPFEADTSNILARVNGALNAAPEERNRYMKYKLRCAVLVAAATLLLIGSALAAVSNWDALSVFFTGDTSGAQEYLQTPNLSVSDGQFTVTLESSVTDTKNAYALVKVQALTERARTKLESELFIFGSNFACLQFDADGNLPQGVSGFSLQEITERRAESSRVYALSPRLSQDAVRAVLSFGFLPEGMTLNIPLDHPAEHLELCANYVVSDSRGESYRFLGATITPLSFQIRHSGTVHTPSHLLFFRMADGSVCTANQLSWPTGASQLDSNYRFLGVQDLDNLSALILGNMEFPLDGSDPYPVEVDAKLQPFTLPYLGGLKVENNLRPVIAPVSVRALCEKLGGKCIWNPDTQSATLTYRGVTIALTLGSSTAMVDGKAVTLAHAPELLDEQMALVPNIFLKYWSIRIGGLMDNNYKYIIAYEIMP